MAAATMGKAVTLLLRTADNGYELNSSAFEEMKKQKHLLNRKLIVIAIVGEYRQGKSFFLNYIMKYLQKQGCKDWIQDDKKLPKFTSKGGSQRVTEGIHMWSHAFPLGDDHAVVLLDTEGTYDEMSTYKTMSQVFACSALSSSILIYNVHERITKQTMQEVQCFAEYGKYTSSSHNFGRLLFLIRDWPYVNETAYGLQGGKKHLEHWFKVDEDRVAESLQNSFESIDCYNMPHPGVSLENKASRDIEKLGLSEEFKTHLREAVENIFSPPLIAAKSLDERELTLKDFPQVFSANLDALMKSNFDMKSMYEIQLEEYLIKMKNEALIKYTEMINKFMKSSKSVSEFTKNESTAEQAALSLFDDSPKLQGANISLYRSLLQKELNAKKVQYNIEYKSNKEELEAMDNNITTLKDQISQINRNKSIPKKTTKTSSNKNDIKTSQNNESNEESLENDIISDSSIPNRTKIEERRAALELRKRLIKKQKQEASSIKILILILFIFISYMVYTMVQVRNSNIEAKDKALHHYIDAMQNSLSFETPHEYLQNLHEKYKSSALQSIPEQREIFTYFGSYKESLTKDIELIYKVFEVQNNFLKYIEKKERESNKIVNNLQQKIENLEIKLTSQQIELENKQNIYLNEMTSQQIELENKQNIYLNEMMSQQKELENKQNIYLNEMTSQQIELENKQNIYLNEMMSQQKELENKQNIYLNEMTSQQKELENKQNIYLNEMTSQQIELENKQNIYLNEMTSHQIELENKQNIYLNEIKSKYLEYESKMLTNAKEIILILEENKNNYIDKLIETYEQLEKFKNENKNYKDIMLQGNRKSNKIKVIGKDLQCNDKEFVENDTNYITPIITIFNAINLCMKVCYSCFFYIQCNEFLFYL